MFEGDSAEKPFFEESSLHAVLFGVPRQFGEECTVLC